MGPHLPKPNNSQGKQWGKALLTPRQSLNASLKPRTGRTFELSEVGKHGLLMLLVVVYEIMLPDVYHYARQSSHPCPPYAAR